MKTKSVSALTLLEIPFIYLAISLTWIIAGNELLQFLTADLSAEAKHTYQTYKGTIFVAVTAVMLFLLLKRQQQKLIASERQYRSLFANNPNPMYVFNIQTKRIITANDAAVAKYGIQ